MTGFVFLDANADGQRADDEGGLAQVSVNLVAGDGQRRTTHTDDSGAFGFDAVVSGTYRLEIDIPPDYIQTTDAGQDLEVRPGIQPAEAGFGLISAATAGLITSPDQAAIDAAAEAEDEQVMALSSVSSLPLRFAQGRDLMAQVARRVLGDGLVWLGVPFRSQIDGGNFQYVNCGPASLTMVLAGFGLEVGPSQVRDYLNNLIDNFDPDLGTSLDVLSRIGTQAGLTSMDLYSDKGGYRNWSTDAVRFHIQQGHPVITLVKYRNLPGHTRSLSEFDHYIVISGLTPNGFIYNDAAFATTLGYGLEISDIELEYAWNNSSIPHHAVALGLDPDKHALTFPELPRARLQVAEDAEPVPVNRAMRRLVEEDAVATERAPLVLTPTLPMPAASGPLITSADPWKEEPEVEPPPTEATAPMGMTMEATQQPTLEPRPGPGAIVPKLLSLVGVVWGLWLVWAASGRFVRWRPSLSIRSIRGGARS